ncbi:MAG: hypothetical protein M1415_10810 [Firmicutes bacterium]|nr:hypothetical protein [Bacillota bacterium]MCL5065966.1 hypothetical protein [Bacillota bacterium]
MLSGRMVQAELGFGELYLTITQALAEPVLPESGKAGGLNIVEIHLSIVSNGEAALAVSGRGLRSVKQGRAKAQASSGRSELARNPGHADASV